MSKKNKFSLRSSRLLIQGLALGTFLSASVPVSASGINSVEEADSESNFLELEDSKTELLAKESEKESEVVEETDDDNKEPVKDTEDKAKESKEVVDDQQENKSETKTEATQVAEEVIQAEEDKVRPRPSTSQRRVNSRPKRQSDIIGDGIPIKPDKTKKPQDEKDAKKEEVEEAEEIIEDLVEEEQEKIDKNSKDKFLLKAPEKRRLNLLDEEVFERKTDVLIERKSTANSELKEMGLILYSNNTKGLSHYDDEKGIVEVDIEDNTLLNITGKLLHNNHIYYRAEISKEEASSSISNYLDVKDHFNAEGQEGLDLSIDLLDEFINNLSTISYEDEDGEVEIDSQPEASNNNFVFYIHGNEVIKEMDREEIDKNVYAKKDVTLLSLDGKATPIKKILETEELRVVGENNKWYFVDLQDVADINLNDEEDQEAHANKNFGIVSKRYFSETEFFAPEYRVLRAKDRVPLYTNAEDDIQSGYFVKQGGRITQIEKSANWAKLKLRTGEELFAKLDDFDIDEVVYVDESPEDRASGSTRRVRRLRRVRDRIPEEEIIAQSLRGRTRGSQLVDFAMNFVGGRYVWGGNSLENGVDCSGYVREVYKRFGVNLPRHSSQQARVGRAVSIEEAMPGDIIAYDGHVGLYMGNGKMVHAANSRKGIIVTDLQYMGNYHTIRRVFE